MKSQYLSRLSEKYYQLLKKLLRLTKKSGDTHKKQSLLLKVKRLKLRIIRSGTLSGKLALLTAAVFAWGNHLSSQESSFNAFRNTGEVNPFGITPANIANISPIFVDIDRDGDFDLFCGSANGDILFFKNQGSREIPDFDLPLINPYNIDPVLTPSSPTFIDIDGDGDLDLFNSSRQGNLVFQENIGTPTLANWDSPIYSPFGLVSLPDYLQLTFGDIDLDGDYDLFVGGEGVNLAFYENIGDSSSPTFVHNTDAYLNVQSTPLHSQLKPTLCDLDMDGDLDLLAGSRQGTTLPIFNASITDHAESISITNSLELISSDFFHFKNLQSATFPAIVDIDDDGDLDAFIGTTSGNLYFLPGRMAGDSANAVLIENSSTDPFHLSRTPGGNSTLADVDNDGDLDMFYIGDEKVYFVENIGTRFDPNFAPPNSTMHLLGYITNSNDSNFGGDSGHVAFADIDGDGDLDAFVQSNEYIYSSTYYPTAVFKNSPNQDGAQFEFFDKDPYFLYNSYYYSVHFNFVDLDMDGDLESVFTEDNYVFYLDNIGNSTSPDFDTYALLFTLNNPVSGAPQFVDIDNDGDLDMLFGTAGDTNYDIRAYEFDADASPKFSSITGLGSYKLTTDLTNPQHINLIDIDSDGDLDIIATSESGNIYFLKNINCATDMQANHFLPHRSTFTSMNITQSIGHIPPGRDIILEAGNSIGLLPKFEVDNDEVSLMHQASLTAQIGGCKMEITD